MSDISITKDWLLHSYNNLISARHLCDDIHPKQTEIACYLSQQCAETALKGYLFYRDIDPPRIHDLAGLCRLCMVQDPSFQLILLECERLNPYGVNVRYPNELAIDDTIAKTAIERAQKIYDFCMANVLTAEDVE